MDANLLQYFKNIHQNPPTDLIDKFNSQEKIHLLKNVFPCFFTGNLGLKNPFVTISLNPKYDDAKIKDQGTDFEIWINNCSEKGFSGYEDDKKLHLIWKNLAKVFFSEEDSSSATESLAKSILLFTFVIGSSFFGSGLIGKR